jgi:hypothetical protein
LASFAPQLQAAASSVPVVVSALALGLSPAFFSWH